MKGSSLKLERGALSKDHHALDQFAELQERWEDRLTLKNLSLAKRYMDFNLNLLIEANWGAMNFNIVIHRTDLVGQSPPVPNLLTDREASIVQSKGELDSCFNIERRTCSWDDAIVLIEDVHSVQREKRGVPSTITLHPKDAALGFGADALYFGHGTGFKLFTGLFNEKPAMSSWRMSVCSNQIANQKIKSASKVVNDIPNDRAKASWDRFVDSEAKDALASLRVIVADEFVRVGFVEPRDEAIQFTNVLFGPFKL